MPIKLATFFMKAGGDLARSAVLEAIVKASIDCDQLELEPLRTSLNMTPEGMAEALGYLAEKGYLQPVTDEAAGDVPWDNVTHISPVTLVSRVRYTIRAQAAFDFADKKAKAAMVGEPEPFTDRHGNVYVAIVSNRRAPDGKTFDGTFVLTITKDTPEGDQLFLKDGFESPTAAWDVWEDYIAIAKQELDIILWATTALIPKHDEPSGTYFVHLDAETFPVFWAATEEVTDGTWAYPGEDAIQHQGGTVYGLAPGGDYAGHRWPGLEPIEVDPTDDEEDLDPLPDAKHTADVSTTLGWMHVRISDAPEGSGHIWEAWITGEGLKSPIKQTFKAEPMPESDEALGAYATEHFVPIFLREIKAQG